MDKKPKLYIGCSLTLVTQEFRDKVKDFKKSLQGKYEVLEFIGLERGTDQDVYRHDIQECVAGCDLLVAFCDLPAIGLGYELGTAIEKYSKPVLAVAHIDSKVTCLVLGIDHPMYTFSRYSNISEVAGLIDQKVQKHFPQIAVNVCTTDVCTV